MARQHSTTKDKLRRRRLRALTVVVFTLATLGLAWFLESRETTTIIFVRHADTDGSVGQGSDPPLNARGRARAELLADFLVDVDVVAGVNAIYVSEFQSTKQTAAPLAGRLGLEVVVDDHYDPIGFMRDVLRDRSGEIVLIVSQADAIPVLVDELHGKKGIVFEPDEYSTMYIVTHPAFGRRVKTLRFPYAVGWPPAFEASSRLTE